MARQPLASDDRIDFDYDVATPINDVGTLLRMAPVGETPSEERSAKACFEELHGRQAPCADCPLLDADGGRELKTRITVRVVDEAVEIITAETISGSVARVSVRHLSAHAQRAVHDAKLEHLATQARLSARERSVLRYLAMGRSLDDIAKILGISPRTVKFHQANVLEKVGADSRQDLARLIC